jgi:aryl-alcohol dehydrogenase-like predicted oxidoreductase
MANTSDAIPLRSFGRHDVKISALGFGGHHLGDASDENAAVRLVRQAVDGGVTFFDNCWEYHRGKTEVWMGAALKGLRDRVFLMTKVCTHGRDKALALRMLDESLRRLRTDHLDLWQIHGVCFENDPALFIRKDGAAEALEQAKKEGKVRFVGFTGHKDPSIHSVQMPLNAFDAHFHSFEQQVLPELNRRGIAALGMKPICGHGEPVQKGVLTGEEALKYAMSLPVTTTITGIDKPEALQQALKVAQGFEPLKSSAMQSLRDRCRTYAADGRFELYKLSLRFDNPEARLAHGFPLDMEQVETREMVKMADNSGRPFPPTK